MCHKFALSVVFLSSLFFTSCSKLFIAENQKQSINNSVNSSSNEKSTNETRITRTNTSEPFLLEVLAEEFSANELFLTLGFVGFEPFSPKEAVIRIATIDEGNLVSEKIFSISDLHNKAQLTKNKSKNIKLAVKYKYGVNIEAKAGIDYQVELLWGKDALSFVNPAKTEKKKIVNNESSYLNALSKKVPLPNSKILEITEKNISKTKFCHNKNECEIEYKISANILNSSQEAVKNMTLAVGFLDKESKEYSFGVRVPKDEELLEIDSVILNPGMNQSISLTLDQRVPESEQKRYEPVLRVVKN